MSLHTSRPNVSSCGVAVAAVAALAIGQWQPVEAEQSPAALANRPCRVHGTVLGGDAPLPGATITARAGDQVAAVTSTDLDGGYLVALAPGTYTLHVQLSAFAPADREVTVGMPPCEATADMKLVLASRVPGYVRPVPGAAVAVAPAPGAGRGNGATAGSGQPAAPAAANGQVAAATNPAAAPQDATAATAGRGRGQGAGPGGRGGRGGVQAQRFQSLAVEQTAATTGGASEAVLDVTSSNEQDPAARLLPAGFSPDAVMESVAVSGTMVEVDRNLLNDRLQALGRGEFGLAEGQQAGQPGQNSLLAQIGEGAGRGGAGGAGGPGGGVGGGGRGGGGILGGRGGAAGRLQVSATYGLGGSMFDSAPYALRGEAPQKRDYLQQSFSTTIGGPVKIPGIYDGTNRTTFNFSYTGGRNSNLFDQYATVPSLAYRAGDFSASPVAIINPATGLPFDNNQIPIGMMSPSALALLRYFPEPNLSGDTRNFHVSDTTVSTTDTFALRFQHTFTQPQAGRGGGRGGAGGAGGRGGGAAGGAGAPAGRGAGAAGQGRGGAGGRGVFQPPLDITMSATVNYRRNDGERSNVFPALAGTTKGTTLSVPVTVNVRQGRWMHAFSGSLSRTASSTLNNFAFVDNITGLAGIRGVATDPFDWGVPSLTFGTFTALRDTAPSRRTDTSWTLGYTVTRMVGNHNYRAGASYQQQLNKTQSDSNARGTFTFSGLYTAGGQNTVRGSGQDFADFLLGLPQQATRQYSVDVDNISSPIVIRGRGLSAFFQDDWRWKARWTINYGVQWDYTAPSTEINGHMVNLDVAPDFSAVSAVLPGETGLLSGTVFPSGLVRPDWNNLAPRIGAAWRASNREVVRFGYGLSYNSGAYSAIARNLYQQPPFFLTGTSIGSLASPLTLADPFANITASTVTNTYGIDPNYSLGLIHQWTADYSRDLFRTWAVGMTYIGTRGSNLDMLRAPNRGPTGLRIAGVQSFTWQSAEGLSHMNGISWRVQKRQARGISGSASYTYSRAWDNTTATGGGATVAQDDTNLAAEWGRSNFDRRHQLSGSLSVELPFGRNRPWLDQGGWLAMIVGDWSLSTNLSYQSGQPLTARCSTCASDIARGTGGTLRANYNGDAISLGDPTIDQYFNTSAFSIPASGTFGNSPRNLITGPGSKSMNMQISRDVALGGNRAVTINVNASNLLNLVNYAGIDTNVNSPTFGQVLSVNGRRSVRVNLRFRF